MKYESGADKKFNEFDKMERKLTQKIVEGEFKWTEKKKTDEFDPEETPEEKQERKTKENAELIPSKIALDVIVDIAIEQGGISDLGNLEKTLLQIVQSAAEDSDLDELKEQKGIADRPSLETVLEALEKLASAIGGLTPKLEKACLELLYTDEPSPEGTLKALERLAHITNGLTPELVEVYMGNLELIYTNQIKDCKQEWECIESLLDAAALKATAAQIGVETIQKFKDQINEWAYSEEMT